MKKIKFLVIAAITAVLMSACGTTQTVPLTGRKHNLRVTDQQVLSLSSQEYTKYMASAKKSTNSANTAMVQRVGKNLASAVETYLKNNGFASEISNFSWEFNLVQNNEVNAFCMPGGKIVVYEGLLPYTQNETGLAIVLGHEIAHAVAKHSAEQLSKQMNQQTGTQILGSVLNQAVGDGVGDLASAVAGQYFSFRNLKYSRDMAGYNPQQAIPFWQRMSQNSSSQSDFFSDHPSDAKRIAALQQHMPVALKYYQAAKPAITATAKKTTTKKTTTKKTTTKKTTSTKKTTRR